MALIRTITVGYQGPGKKIERVVETVPAEWISGDRDAMQELLENERVRTRIAISSESTPLWVQISDSATSLV